MSEHLTHIAVFEDCARLVQASDAFPEAFRESLHAYWDAGLLASASRGNHLFAVPFLEKYRDRWNDRPSDGSVEAAIAAAIGWITHRAADLQMKPLSWEFEARLKNDPSPLGDVDVFDDEFEIYQDAVTFREVYDGGRIQPGTPYEPLSSATLAVHMESHPAVEAVDVAHVEPLFAAQVQHDLLLAQSFTTAEKSLEAWIDTFAGRLNGFTEDLQVYITASQPPPNRNQEHATKMVYYIDRVNWYNAADDVIRWARALQRGLPPPATPLDEAITMGRTQSQYAQALHRCYNYLLAAGAFFDHRMEKDVLYDALENFNPSHRI